MPGNTFLPKAGPLGTAIAISVASVIMIIIALNYHYMINKFPVAGGEFIYTQNAFGKTNAFLCSWFLGLSYLAIVPLNATALALIGRNLMGGIFKVGFHYTVAGYDIYLGEILLAVVALLVFAILISRGAKLTGTFQSILALALVVGVLVIAVAAMFSPHASWSNLSPAYYPGDNFLAGVLAVIAVAPWAFVGFDTVPQAAEEFNFSTKKAIVILITAIIFGGAVYVINNTVTAAVVPAGFSSWAEYIDSSSSMSGLAALPTFNAANILLGKAGLFFIGVAVLGAILSGICGFYMATSRLLYSLSENHVLPAWFGKLHPKYKTPVNAIVFIMTISLLAPFFGRNALGWIVDMSSTGAAIGYGYTSAAALKYALKEKRIAYTATGIIGIIMSIGFLVLLLVPIPLFGCSLGKESYICLIVWIILGLILYFVSRKK